MNPWPRQLVVRSVLVFTVLVAALALRVPRPVEKISDLRDSVGEHRALLSAGHASFSCATCHISHAAKAQRPAWQRAGSEDSAIFMRESDAVGGVKTGLCMSCHDGTIASVSSAHTVASGDARRPFQSIDMRASHPVGGDYMAAVRSDPDSYNDPVMNNRIVLEDGKVGCISCHATHDLSAVSASNVRHEVCIECHRR
ncbi:MAG: hypothetical protein HYX59_01840 [Elusimicrobia bacterium]|nr:hypothetical protein [Elusimicrobiota bacterium]